jgi:YidC/Oxa1 family membrane protein insertase
MEKRLFLAIVICFLILVFYQVLFIKKPPPIPSPESTMEIEKKPVENLYEKESLPPAERSRQPEKAGEERKAQSISAEIEKQIIIDTSLYHAVWSNKGGVLQSWRLKEHRDEKNEDLELVPLRSSQTNIYPFSLRSEPSSRTEPSSFDKTINSALYKSSIPVLELKNGKGGELRFQYADEKGTRVEKIFTFQDGKYDFDVQINVWRNGQKIEPGVLWGPGIGNPTPSDQKKRFGGGSGMAVFQSQKVKQRKENKYMPIGKWQDLVSKNGDSFFYVQWAAYEDNYFTALFLAASQKSSANFLREGPEQAPYFLLSISSPQKVFIGPKDFDILKDFGYEAKKLIKYGLFGFISEILLRALKAIHKVFPNWGFSIIILTIIIKIFLFPLTYSSTKSMSKMQDLQPKIKALRAKYKKSKTDIAQRRKMNEETMKLYKEHGVNPAGGCLPMLLQLPIFFGFFMLLRQSIEIRHSPFILWIVDLSVSDPYYVTPILMGATQFISQKMMPTSADPSQARMMLIMPVVMTFLFMSFPSGLVLYWLTNNVLQIAQQYIMNRIKQKKKRESHGKKRNK